MIGCEKDKKISEMRDMMQIDSCFFDMYYSNPNQCTNYP